MKNTFLHQKSERISFKKALLWIMFSILLISGPATLGLFYYQHVRSLRIHDDKYKIIAIVQTTTGKSPLKTPYFTELLDLAVDRPINLYRFSAKEGTRRILASPLIKYAQIKKIKPGTLHIDYTSREPIAFLEDYTNTALDAEGYPFPFKPFYTPKKLPLIYLGASYPLEGTAPDWNGWGSPIQGKRVQLALSILNYLLNNGCCELQQVHRLDVSRAYASSYGQREIVLEIEEQIEKEEQGRISLVISPHILRLNAENYQDSFTNYIDLRPYLEKKAAPFLKLDQTIRAPATTIDLRIPQLAYISPTPKGS